MTPGPVIGPQKNIGTLLCPMGCYKTQGLKTPAIEGSQQGQITKKGIRLDFLLRECNGVPTKLWGFQPPTSRDHRCSPNY